MSIEIARRLARAIGVKSETSIRTINEAILEYVRLTQQSPTVESVTSINLNDSANIDAFGRLRVSAPVSLWTSEFQYNKHPLFFDEVVATGGTVTHLPNESAVSLAVTTSSGSKAIMQTFEYFRYQPGKSQVIAMTFVADAQQADTDMRIGYFDDENGFFLELDGLVVNMVRRSKTSGSVVDNKVAQADWNIDAMDGAGVSRKILDLTKGQILWMDLQWLSLGRIRMGFDIDGVITYVHEFMVANTLTVPSSTTGNLPVRWEIINTGGVAAIRTLTAICSTVFAEGGVDFELGHAFSGGNGATTRGISTTPVPICSIRPALLFNSIANRIKIEIESMEIVTNQDVFWQLIYKPTSITNETFAVGPVTHSSVEVDIAGTAIVGGIIVDSGYISAGSKKVPGAQRVPFLSKMPFTLDVAGSDQSRSVSLVLTRVSTDGDCAAQFNWREIR
jgi:hypothetical protein